MSKQPKLTTGEQVQSSIHNDEGVCTGFTTKPTTGEWTVEPVKRSDGTPWPGLAYVACGGNLHGSMNEQVAIHLVADINAALVEDKKYYAAWRLTVNEEHRKQLDAERERFDTLQWQAAELHDRAQRAEKQLAYERERCDEIWRIGKAELAAEKHQPKPAGEWTVERVAGYATLQDGHELLADDINAALTAERQQILNRESRWNESEAENKQLRAELAAEREALREHKELLRKCEYHGVQYPWNEVLLQRDESRQQLADEREKVQTLVDALKQIELGKDGHEPSWEAMTAKDALARVKEGKQ